MSPSNAALRGLAAWIADDRQPVATRTLAACGVLVLLALFAPFIGLLWVTTRRQLR